MMPAVANGSYITARVYDGGYNLRIVRGAFYEVEGVQFIFTPIYVRYYEDIDPDHELGQAIAGLTVDRDTPAEHISPLIQVFELSTGARIPFERHYKTNKRTLAEISVLMNKIRFSLDKWGERLIVHNKLKKNIKVPLKFPINYNLNTPCV